MLFVLAMLLALPLAAQAVTNTWSAAGSLTTGRYSHTATLLPSGKVLVAGGLGNAGYLASAELYDPVTNTWSAAGNLTTARNQHTATLLPSGKVLVAGGYNAGKLASAELYALDLGIAGNRRPLIGTVNSPLSIGSSLQLTGSGFTGDSEASSGDTQSSATNSPLVQLRRVDNDQIVWTSPAASSSRSDTSYASAPLSGLPLGAYALTVFVNAIPSFSQVIRVVAPTTHNVTPSAGSNGSISPNNVQVVIDGATTSFTVTPSTGYTSSVGGSCGGTLSGTTYTTNPITADCTVIASFTINTYTVTATAGANGTITPATQSVNYGSTASFTVTPSTGYTAAVTGDTCTVTNTSGTTWTSNAITSNCAVTATFTINTYTVTASGGTNGTITPASQSVNYGSTASFTVTPSTGYTATVTGDTCTVTHGSGTSWTSNAITANCAVTATFTINTYTVTASAGTNGTITPATQSVNYGSTASFTVTPGTGYTASVTGDTCTVTHGSGTTWTTSAITANCAVVATFVGVPALAITISDGHAFARYGVLLNYVVTVTNSGAGDATNVSLANILPAQLDAANTNWTCFGAGVGAICTPSGTGALNDSGIAIPAGRSLTWLLNAPVFPDASGATVDNTVSVSVGVSTVSATDSDILVIYRNGFEASSGTTVQDVPTQTVAGASCVADPTSETLDATSLRVVTVPTTLAQAPVDTILVALTGTDASFRIERLNLDTTPRVRLVVVAQDRIERASAWAATQAGAPLSLATVEADDGNRVLLLEGAASSLAMPLPATFANTLRLKYQVSVNGKCH